MPSDWWADFVNENPVPQGSLDYFAKIDWTNKYLQNPNYEAVPLFSRTLKPNGEDYYFAKTIGTAQTVPHLICLKTKEYHVPDAVKTGKRQTTASDPKKAAIPPEQPECVYLMSTGQSGLDGHPNIMHGGVSCAILDEAIGFMVMLHVHYIEGPVRKSRAYTVSLNTSYRAPVPTPADLLVRTWLVRQQGKKWCAMGQIVDNKGTVLSEAESLYIVVPAEKL